LSATSVLARKWRPGIFAQLVGQEHVVRALSNALSQNRLHHAYLFTGTRGVGKTTIARIFAKSLNCAKGITDLPCGECSACKGIENGNFVDLIELDAASNTQVDNMRELLESSLYAPTSGRFKVYIIDEVHMLSKSAFNAMLKTLEEPPGHVKFILATTDPQKIPITVLSRCLQFNLKQLPHSLIASRLKYVAQQENISSDLSAINLIACAAQGSMRDALSLLDQAIAFGAGRVDEATVRSMLGVIDKDCLYDLLAALRDRDGKKLLETAESMSVRSLALDAALQDLAKIIYRIALVQSTPHAIAEDEPWREQLQILARDLSAEEVQLFYQIAIHGRNEIELAPDESVGFSMALLRMLAFAPAPDGDSAQHSPRLPAFDMQTNAKPSNEIKTQDDGIATSEIFANDSALKLKSSFGQIPANEQPDWTALLAHLNVHGMAQQLARHCVLQSFSDEEITLRLSQECKHLHTNKGAVIKLQAALEEYFAKPLRLTVLLGEVKADTPALIEQQDKHLKLKQATDLIVKDSFVLDSQVELEASLITESIKPI